MIWEKLGEGKPWSGHINKKENKQKEIWLENRRYSRNHGVSVLC